MFGWRKRNDGFEWREYVRTTILVRRRKRKQRIDEVKDAAVFGARQAGRSGWRFGVAAALTAAEATRRGAAWAARTLLDVSRSGGRATLAFARVALAQIAVLSGRLARGVAASARRAGDVLIPLAARAGWRTLEVLAPLLEPLRRAEIALPIGIIGAVAALAGFGRLAARGLDGQSLAALLIALVAVQLLLLPRLQADEIHRPVALLGDALSGAAAALRRVPGLDRLGPHPAATLGLGSALIVAAVWLAPAASGLLSALPSLPALTSPPLTGSARAVWGDTLKIDSALVRLEGIEAPDRQQWCTRQGTRRWRCGEAARAALARLLSGKRISCDINGEAEPGLKLGRCSMADTDIAAELVRAGHVFAETGLFAAYAALEDEARDARAGVWSGEAERPSDFREKKWQEAARQAPDGCPIKGQVSAADGLVYVLPWQPTYERTTLRTAKGERWFCSEDEARAAGWRPSSQS